MLTCCFAFIFAKIKPLIYFRKFTVSTCSSQRSSWFFGGLLIATIFEYLKALREIFSVKVSWTIKACITMFISIILHVNPDNVLMQFTFPITKTLVIISYWVMARSNPTKTLPTDAHSEVPKCKTVLT